MVVVVGILLQSPRQPTTMITMMTTMMVMVMVVAGAWWMVIDDWWLMMGDGWWMVDDGWWMMDDLWLIIDEDDDDDGDGWFSFSNMNLTMIESAIKWQSAPTAWWFQGFCSENDRLGMMFPACLFPCLEMGFSLNQSNQPHRRCSPNCNWN